jgi:formylglycine-generating enzyme required for sulfatase activity
MSKEPTNPSLKASIGLVKRVPGGQFTRGSRFHLRESPARIITLPEFEIAHVQVTVNQYSAFVESGSIGEERWWDETGWNWLHGKEDGWGRDDRFTPDAWQVQKKRPHHPVTGVTWYEARAYCAWLSNQKSQTIRLPTEDEWEYAARGEDGRPFPWGETFDSSLANTLESGNQDTVEAGSFEGDISPFEVHDMGGNVQEWTASEYIPLPGEVYPSEVLYVARGGSFNDGAFGARVSYRRAYPPGFFYPFLGFRVVVAHL